MSCRADKYGGPSHNKKTRMTPCTHEAEYGVLCHIHARQIAGTPVGFQFNRIRRIHLSNLSDEEVEEAVRKYREAKGDIKHLPRCPASYREQVFDFIKNSDGRRAGEVVDFVHGLTGDNRLTSSQIGSILGSLTKAGRIVRRLSSVDRGDGRYVGSAVYEAV